jgi:hypothetical protein
MPVFLLAGAHCLGQDRRWAESLKMKKLVSQDEKIGQETL